MDNILDKICIKKKEELISIKNKCSLKSLKKLLPNKENRNLKKLLQFSQKNQKNNIIAEIKKSSPSAGIILQNYFPEEIAIQYEKSGAGAISVLTESHFFSGHLDHLSLINRKSNLPILRKDFIIDSYQVYESKIFKADAILLIATILDDVQIQEFINIADEVGLDCIIEIHNAYELDRAIKINYPIIGINNRNLDSLSVDTDNTTNLINEIPKDFTVIGESGINSFSDIEKYNRKGIYNFLIGESLLKSENINLKFNELLNK